MNHNILNSIAIIILAIAVIYTNSSLQTIHIKHDIAPTYINPPQLTDAQLTCMRLQKEAEQLDFIYADSSKRYIDIKFKPIAKNRVQGVVLCDASDGSNNILFISNQ